MIEVHPPVWDPESRLFSCRLPLSHCQFRQCSDCPDAATSWYSTWKTLVLSILITASQFCSHKGKNERFFSCILCWHAPVTVYLLTTLGPPKLCERRVGCSCDIANILGWFSVSNKCFDVNLWQVCTQQSNLFWIQRTSNCAAVGRKCVEIVELESG